MEPFTAEELAYMETKPEVFVIGNPSLYPIEYYDPALGMFRGMIPEQFEEITKETGIRFTYINTSKESSDQRLLLAKNKQAEILSGYQKNTQEAAENGLLLSSTYFKIPSEESTEQIKVCLAYTQISPNQLESIVDKYMSGISIEQKEQYYLTHLAPVPDYYMELKMDLGISVAVSVIMLALALWQILRRRHYKKRYLYYKFTDYLTGHMNYNAFCNEYKYMVKEKNGGVYWLVHFDLGLVALSEVYGAKEAESILLETASILHNGMKKEEIFCRMDGNYYILLLKGASQAGIEQRLLSYKEEMDRYCIEENKAYGLNLSMGVYGLRKSDTELDTPIYHAMLSQRHAKEKGQLIVVYDSVIEHIKSEEIRLEQDLLMAFLNQEFVLYLQPFFWMKEHRLAGCEALVRWEHPLRGLVKPQKFIPILERNQMMSRLDLLMFEESCKILKRRLENGQDLFWISCNFSKQSFETPSFFEDLIKVARRYQVPADYLPIEITEGLESQESEVTKSLVKQLVDEGFPLIIDNFGCGYTSFLDLTRYPIRIVKLDKQLLDEIDYENMKVSIVGLLEIIHNMNRLVMCKGVEKESQAVLMKGLGCDLAQGYLYYQPMSYEEFLTEVEA